MTHTTSKPRIFVTGGTGYIGGSFLHLMLQRDYLSRFDIAALVRQPSDAKRLQDLGITPVVGSLDDHELLRSEAARADIVFNTANCDHQASAADIVRGLTQRSRETGQRPILIHTSGAGVLSDTSTGTGVPPAQDTKATIWDDADSAAHAEIPSYAPHRFVDLEVFAAARSGLVKTYLVVPPTVFGLGLGPFAERRMSIQIPRLIHHTLLRRQAMYVGSGENVWPNVHVADLAELYLLIMEAALKGTAPEGLSGLFYPVTEHFTWATVSHRIAEVLYSKQLLPRPVATSGLQRGWFWGSNVRLLSTNGQKLGWTPNHGGTRAMLDGVESDLGLVVEMIRSHNTA